MNNLLRRYARQSHEQNAAKTFCAIDTAMPGRILGFYTITPSAVAHEHVPPTMTRGIARHEVAGYKLADRDRRVGRRTQAWAADF